MFNRLFNPRTNRSRRSPRADLAAGERWENEGGGGTPPAPLPDPIETTSSNLESGTTMLAASTPLDARQDELMAVASSDGRPPPRWMRLTEWRWSGAIATLVLAGIIVWIAFNGVSLVTVLASLAFAVLLLVSASPVLGAGLMRGREERAARAASGREQRPRTNQ